MMWIFFIALPGAILGLSVFLVWALWQFFSPQKKLQVLGASLAGGALVLFILSFIGFLLREHDNVFFAFAWEFLAWGVVPMIYFAFWAIVGTILFKTFSTLLRFKYFFAGTGVVLVAGVCIHGYWKFENPRVTHLVWKTSSGELIEKETNTEVVLGERKFRFVATADWHLGDRIGRARTEKFVHLVNAQNPDFVVISGDLIDGRIESVENRQLDEVLNKINAPLGVYAALGNHEYFGNLTRIKEFIHRSKIRLLQDERTVLKTQEGRDLVQIVGRDDATNRARLAVRSLIDGKASSTVPLILLDHQPHGAEEATDAGVDFVFCGHTHAGQLWPATWLVGLFNPHVYGTWKENKTLGFVTSGLGLWHIPYRIGSFSELVVVDVY